MRDRLRLFVLVGLAALLAWLQTRPADTVQVVQPVARSNALAARASVELVPTPEPHQILPTQLDRPLLELAQRDPFAIDLPKPAPLLPKQSVPPPAASIAMPLPPPPPVPMAPPHNLRFAGRMRTPEGRELVYVSLGDTGIVLVAGQTLPNGYRVESVTARSVELSYPPLNTRTRLDLPEPPRYEIR